jgi:hypothetical protein
MLQLLLTLSQCQIFEASGTPTTATAVVLEDSFTLLPQPTAADTDSSFVPFVTSASPSSAPPIGELTPYGPARKSFY